jgi:hypothetical protein
VQALVHTPAFGFEEREFYWGDVVLAAIAWGEWQQLERTLAEGLACMIEAGAGGAGIDEEGIHAAVVAFRRARQLLAGDDYLRWLADRGLGPSDLEAHLERNALRERAADRLDEILAAHRPEGAQVAAMARAEAVLSGRLHAWAERLAGCAAAARGLAASGEKPPGATAEAVTALLDGVSACPATGLTAGRDRAARITTLLAAEQPFRERAVTRERLERCLHQHRLDWQRFVWDQVTFPREGAAREAALSVREEDAALGAVAALARARIEVKEAYFDQASGLAGLLAAATPGELIGPLECDGGWQLVRMRERAPAVIEDPALRERATAELLADALERHAAGRVHWHGQY